MKSFTAVLLCALLFAACPHAGLGQDSAFVGAQPVVPHLVRYSGALPPAATAMPAEVLRFAIYAAEAGGEPLWTEDQSVSVDVTGKYAVLLGSVKALPDALFAGGTARWVGVSLSGQPEAPRTPLTAYAYSIKASDAETVGGHPASDFMLAPKSADGKGDAATPITQINTSNGLVGGGTGPTLNLSISDTFLESLGNGIYAQLGAANTLTGNQTVNGNLTVNGSLGGSAVNGLLSAADTVYPQLTANNTLSGTNTFSKPVTFASAQTFAGTVALSANNAFTGTDSFSKPVTFASTQTYPNTISGITTTSPLAGSGTSGSVALSLNTGALEATLNTHYPQLATTNTFSGSNTFSQPITFASNQTFPSSGGGGTITGVTAGTDLTGGGTTGSVTLNLNTSALETTLNSTYPQLSGSNTFSNANTFNNSVSISGSATEQLYVSDTGSTAIYGTGMFHGLYGEAATGSGGSGLYASGDIGAQGAGADVGVYGTASASGGYGVEAISASNGYGVYAIGDTGVYALGVSAGVKAKASGSGNGVEGSTTGGAGVFGNFGTLSSTGTTFGASAGVWGDGGSQLGVLGTADDEGAGVFVNNGEDHFTLNVLNDYSTPADAPLANFSDSGGGNCTIVGGGVLSCSGSVTGSIGHSDGRTVSMYAPESTENWFEDYGSGKLENGATTIVLDSDFADLVNTGVAYHVFLTPKGDCKGLFVTHETASGFDVRELGGGTTGIEFDYKIVARRKGYEKIRMADQTERVQRMKDAEQAQRAAMLTHPRPPLDQRQPVPTATTRQPVLPKGPQPATKRVETTPIKK